MDEGYQKRVSDSASDLCDICSPKKPDEYVITSIVDALAILKMLKKDTGRASKFFASKRVSENFPFGLWFRGEPVSDSPLTPSVFRKKKEAFFRERGMIWDVGRRIPECHGLTNHFERLCMAQHYLVPTRLLNEAATRQDKPITSK